MCSNTVYAGMIILASVGKLRSEARMTAEFLKQVNDTFDLLNVRAFGTKTATPLRANSNEQIACLVHMKEVSSSWQAVGKRFGTRPPCFEGLIQDINAILEMHTDLVVSGPLAFLMSGRFNQDCLENLFSQIRARGGHRFNPSAREFRFAYRILCSNFIIARIPSANCAFDHDVMVSSLARISSEACSRSNPHGPSSKRSRLAEVELEVQLVQTSDFETPLEVTNVVTYIGGYLINKLKKSDFSCEPCLSVLSVVNNNVVEDSNLHIHLRAYSHAKGAFGGLTAPSTGLTNILKQGENVFDRNIGHLLVSSS